MSSCVNVWPTDSVAPPRFRSPLPGAAANVYVSCTAVLSTSVTRSSDASIVSVPPSATVAPVLTARTGKSLTGVTVMLNVVVGMLPPAPSETVKSKLSLVVSLPSCVYVSRPALMSSCVNVWPTESVVPPRFRSPLPGTAVNVYSISTVVLSTSVTRSFVVSIVSVSPSATVAPVLTARTGGSLTPWIVTVTAAVSVPPLPSLRV